MCAGSGLGSEFVVGPFLFRDTGFASLTEGVFLFGESAFDTGGDDCEVFFGDPCLDVFLSDGGDSGLEVFLSDGGESGLDVFLSDDELWLIRLGLLSVKEDMYCSCAWHLLRLVAMFGAAGTKLSFSIDVFWSESETFGGASSEACLDVELFFRESFLVQRTLFFLLSMLSDKFVEEDMLDFFWERTVDVFFTDDFFFFVSEIFRLISSVLDFFLFLLWIGVTMAFLRRSTNTDTDSRVVMLFFLLL